jgi:hypothetical protein
VSQPELAGPALATWQRLTILSAAAIIGAIRACRPHSATGGATLAARATGSRTADAVAQTIPAKDVPAYTARQLLDIGDEAIAERCGNCGDMSARPGGKTTADRRLSVGIVH